MAGWLIVAAMVVAVVAALRWWSKGRVVGGYGAADQGLIDSTREDVRLTQRGEGRTRSRDRWSTWLRD